MNRRFLARPVVIAVTVSMLTIPGSASYAVPPAGIDGEWREVSPPVREGQAAVYDPVGDRLVVFGGFNRAPQNDTWVFDVGVTGNQWRLLMVSGTRPTARWGHSMIYDPMGDRVVIFGGYDETGQYKNDVWALSLRPTPGWAQLSSVGGPPPARWMHSAIYDPVRQRMVVCMGVSGSTPSAFNDVWALSLSMTPTWTMLTTLPVGGGPAPRKGQSAIYDPIRDRLVIFSGASASSSSDVWALLFSNNTWSNISPGGVSPAVRQCHSAIYVPAGDRMIVFGGIAGNALFNDAWELSFGPGGSWSDITPPTPPDSPMRRRCHSAVYLPTNNTMILYGGSGSPSGLYIQPEYLSDTWALGLGTAVEWSRLLSLETRLTGRHNTSMIYDSANDRIVIFGGATYGGGPLDDVWSYSFGVSGPIEVWQELHPAGVGPAARESHSAIVDGPGNRMIVFGGVRPGPQFDNDVTALNLTVFGEAWTSLVPSGSPPQGRAGHAAIYDPVRGRMLMFGGSKVIPPSTVVTFSDTWALSLSGTVGWTELLPSGTAPVLEQPQGVYDPLRDRMIVVGKGASAVEVWALSLSGSLAWTVLSPSGTPPSLRSKASVVYDPGRDRLILFGGLNASEIPLRDTWQLTLGGGPAWQQLSPGSPSLARRWQHSAAYIPAQDRMILFGGADELFVGAGIDGDATTYDLHEFNDFWNLAFDQTVGVPDKPAILSSGLQVDPNPATHGTWISFGQHLEGVAIQIFDLAGRKVRSMGPGSLEMGASGVWWDGSSDGGQKLPSGVYLVTARSASMLAHAKLVLAR